MLVYLFTDSFASFLYYMAETKNVFASTNLFNSGKCASKTNVFVNAKTTCASLRVYYSFINNYVHLLLFFQLIARLKYIIFRTIKQ